MPAETPVAGVPAAPAAPRSSQAAEPLRERLISAARRHVGRQFAGDCCGFVRRVFAEARVALPTLMPARSMSESLYRSLRRVATPKPGDLAFFRGTRRDRRATRVSHVALVEAVDGSRVTLIHRGGHGIARFAMNLERPHDRSENGMVRRRRAEDRPGIRYLAAELFGGYASAIGEARASGGSPTKMARQHRRLALESGGVPKA